MNFDELGTAGKTPGVKQVTFALMHPPKAEEGLGGTHGARDDGGAGQVGGGSSLTKTSPTVETRAPTLHGEGLLGLLNFMYAARLKWQ